MVECKVGILPKLGGNTLYLRRNGISRLSLCRRKQTSVVAISSVPPLVNSAKRADIDISSGLTFAFAI